LTSGASTPDNLMEVVVRKLEAFCRAGLKPGPTTAA
jgi:4-hydroxy-3-methylbut-2-enyl diphosphate reductase IspH